MRAGENAVDPGTHSQVLRVLAEVFGFDRLRPGQPEAIEDVLAGRPVVAVMPTGAGKSLCYQLPAVLLGESGGVTLVVSPLIALMKDQVDSLTQRGVPCAALTSAASPAEQRDIIDGICGGRYTLVYVAPERFHSRRFLDALTEVGERLALLAIDEAHCISEWGHEFRPAYRLLGEVMERLRPPRVIALTATATPEVRQDIETQLRLEAPRLHIRGFARPNLDFSVRPVGGAAEKTAQVIELARLRTGGAALVYAATRKNAERYAGALAGAGMRVRAYHAGLDDGARRAAQDAFMDGSLDAIVATNAFGMGVDKADIRLVVHADLPRSPEAYYQESGRGGRDGAPADCVLLFNHGDARLAELLIDSSHPSADLLRGLWRRLREQERGVGGDDPAEELRELLPDRPHPSVLRTALRILSRHGFVTEDGGRTIAIRPGEVGGEFAPLDPQSLERRAEVERGKLRTMVEYAYHHGCRHRFLLEYFGDHAELDHRCSACDNCKDVSRTSPLSEEQSGHVRALLALVGRLGGRFGRRRVAALATGTDDDDRLLALPERGALRGHSQSYALDLLRAVEAAGLITASRGEYPTIRLTRQGAEAADGAGMDSVRLLPPRVRSRAARPPIASGPPAEPIDPDIEARLRQLRHGLASERSVPAYVIFTNRMLESIARARPTTLAELGQVPGIGPSRLDSFGPDILRAVAGQRGGSA